MTTSRLAILLGVVTLGMGAVHLLPKSPGQPTGITLYIPSELFDWTGRDAEVSKKEIDTLGKGTEFARKVFRNTTTGARGYEVLVSIVLSGHDMANSIHRPERCLTAQGWNVLNSTEFVMQLPKRGGFPITRLKNNRVIKTGGGEQVQQSAFTYYWFVGERAIAASHWGRWFTDNRDRLLRGVNQRWAFITVTGIIPSAKDPNLQGEMEKLADRQIRMLIEELAPQIHKDGLSYQ